MTILFLYLVAKEALGLNITLIEIPYTDLKRNINIYIRKKWQTIWDEFPQNKLYQIQPIVGLDKYNFSGKWREEIVLARAHIGHSYMTHSYLLKGDPMPECIPCYCALTVKHILIEWKCIINILMYHISKLCLRMLINLRSLLSLMKLVYLKSFKSYIYYC